MCLWLAVNFPLSSKDNRPAYQRKNMGYFLAQSALKTTNSLCDVNMAPFTPH